MGVWGEHRGRGVVAVGVAGALLAACSLSMPTVGRAGAPPVLGGSRVGAEGRAGTPAPGALPPAVGVGAVEVTPASPEMGPGSLGVAVAAYDQALSTAAARADSAVRGPCPEAVFGALAPERLEPPAKLDGEAGLAFVRERVRVTGCGAPRVHALYPMRTPEGGVRFEAGAPGASIATLEVQREVVRQIVSQAVGHLVAEAEGEFLTDADTVETGDTAGAGDAPDAPRGCDPTVGEPWVLDTELSAPLEGGRWREAWTLGACDRTVTLDIGFELAPKGARFRASIPLTWDDPEAS